MNRRRTASGIRKPPEGITTGMNDAPARRSEKNGEKERRRDDGLETLGGD